MPPMSGWVIMHKCGLIGKEINMRPFLILCGLVFSLIFTPAALATAPPPPRPVPRVIFELEKIGLNVVIDGQKASCTLKYVLYNPGSSPIEVDFLAPLPEGGTLTGVTLFDGKNEMAGNVYGKAEAWEVYQKIVSSLRDPALLEYAGRDTYRARVFPVPAKGRQTLELNFDYLVPKSDGQIGFNFPMAGPMTAGRTPVQEVHAVIRGKEGLSNIYSPLAGVKIDHPAGGDAVITFDMKDAPVIKGFSLYYQDETSSVGGMVLSHKPDKNEDGFFLFLADPSLSAGEQLEAAKNVVFVLDKSGSMSGRKFKQACDALKFVLERLDERDNFNLVDYNGNVSSWQPEMAGMNQENRQSAMRYVDNLRSQGNTNIEEALKTSFAMMGDPTAPNYLVFLTDGQPTVGETNEMKLAKIAEGANPKNAVRLFSFGVGFDVNARLLDRLSGQAGGTSVFVKPDENLESAVSSFFSRLTTPALTRPTLKSGRAINRVIPEELPDLFLGQQLVVAGRYPKGGETTFTLKGRRGEKEEEFAYQVTLADNATPDGSFISQIWAQRRIGELIDEIDLAGGKPSQELVDEMVELSKTYGILTPYTSFLALEEQALTDRSALSAVAADNLSIVRETVGSSANTQRSKKAEMKAVAAPKASMPAQAVQMEAMEMAAMDKEVARQGAGGFNLPKQLAGQTFFFKNGQWQSSDLSEKDIETAKPIKQLSEEYFKLARKLKPEDMVWLTQKEPVIFKHEGVSYLIEPESENEAQG
ncbi:hypothetical protein C4J81_02385 [Deltaproteobacteria bacterium Smac51]|nr:hypothetical protein C4J81_02385 [Deltaproteobacteria bacterium Smac51]